MRYHHLGIPTREKLKDEIHLEHLKMYVSGYGKNGKTPLNRGGT